LAIEASPSTALKLRENIALNGFGNVLVEQCAAWDRDDWVWIDSGELDNVGAARVHGSSSDATTHRVRARRIDDVLVEHKFGNIDVLKVDIEGVELQALRGLSNAFSDSPPRLVYCELSFEDDARAAASRQVMALFEQLGYRGYLFEDDGLKSLTETSLPPGTIDMAVFSRSSLTHPEVPWAAPRPR
jgi:FkbM family methyltransferase